MRRWDGLVDQYMALYAARGVTAEDLRKAANRHPIGELAEPIAHLLPQVKGSPCPSPRSCPNHGPTRRPRSALAGIELNTPTTTKCKPP